MVDCSVAGGGRFGELYRGVKVMEVMAVIDVVECHRCRCEDLEIRGVSVTEGIRSMERVDKYRSAARHTVAQAMKDLVPWRMLEVPFGRRVRL